MYATIGILTLVLALAAGIFVPTPAFAHHKEGHTDNCNIFPESPYCDVEQAFYTLTVESQYVDGSELTGMWTTIETADGETTLDSGYTAIEFTLESEVEYQITVANFDGITFSHWEDDSTSDLDWGARRNLSIDEDTMVIAFYSFPPVDKDGGKIWTGILAFHDAAIDKNLTSENVPESDNEQRMYDFMSGPFGANFRDAAEGWELAYGSGSWNDLTDGQQIWLLENFYNIVAGYL